MDEITLDIELENEAINLDVSISETFETGGFSPDLITGNNELIT